MDDTDNPYLPPDSDETGSNEDAFDWDPDTDPRTVGKARQVRTVAIMMIIHGVLMFLAAAGLVTMIFFLVPQMREQFDRQAQMQRQANPNAPQIAPETMTTMITALYGGMAAALASIGFLGIFAGIRNYSFRNRTLGIVTLVLNIGSIMFCWCVPLSIALLVYGMIIYLSPEADRAFRWTAESKGNAASA
ncbi:MAG: hypothetical protein E6Q76_04520 [Rhizobium sp.]|nr:MAG: hypothetical protein E6Q76_04520 [Rhizobium sp.]